MVIAHNSTSINFAVLWRIPLLIITTTLIDRVDYGVIKSFEDIRKYRVGVVKNVAHHQYLLNNGFEEGENLQAVNNVNLNIKKLFKDRIDLLISNDYTLPILLKNLNLSFNDVQKTYSILESKEGYIAFNKNISDELIQRINTSFLKLKESGQLDNLLISK